VVAPGDAEVRGVEDAAATEVLQAVEDVVAGRATEASGLGRELGSKPAVKLDGGCFLLLKVTVVPFLASLSWP